jgi:hypothetical protein
MGATLRFRLTNPENCLAEFLPPDQNLPPELSPASQQADFRHFRKPRSAADI